MSKSRTLTLNWMKRLSLGAVALSAALLSGCPRCPAYNVTINPADFGTVVDNAFHPLTPGTTYRYEKMTDEGLEVDIIEVTGETKVILGVTCIVVRDTASLEGEVTEDTYDWFAQDMTGNVWYFGEDSKEYEDGVVVSTAGSWEAGVDGALPGIVMPANPVVGDRYYQEFYCGEAEDEARIVALAVSVTVPMGTYEGCLHTEDFTRLEPGLVEDKYYAPGVGFVLAEEEDGNLELVSIAVK